MAINLPLASDNYDASNERQTRRALEDSISDMQSQIASLLTTYGTLSLGETDITLVNSNNDNISIGYATYVRVSGPTAAFAIRGIAGGERGRLVFIRNTVAFNMTLSNENAGSTAANRITTQTGADVVLTGVSSAVLLYDATSSRWIVMATQG